MSHNIRPSLRKRVLREKGDNCYLCKDADVDNMHHIDGDASNDTFDNLIPVCRECHMDIHYSRTELGAEWNEKILPRDERKTGDELRHREFDRSVYDTNDYECEQCGFQMPAYDTPKYCPQCEERGVMALS